MRIPFRGLIIHHPTNTRNTLRQIHNLLGETRTPVQGPERSVNSARPGEDNGGASGSAVGDSGGRGGGGGLTAGRESAATGISATSDESLSLTRGVLERLVMSNTRAYASRKEVSKAMGEFLRDRRKDRGTAGGTEEGLGGGAGASAFADGRRRRGWSRSMRQRVEERRDEEDEEKHNLRSFKRKEAEVLSLTRCVGMRGVMHALLVALSTGWFAGLGYCIWNLFTRCASFLGSAVGRVWHKRWAPRCDSSVRVWYRR